MKVKNESYVYITATVVFAAICVFAFYPGWMSQDSCTQYYQALSGQYCTITPVMMSWWWRCLNYVHKGPGLFLLQNQLCYWIGLGLIAWHMHRRIRYWALLVLLAGFFPPAIVVTAQIWKDVVFTSLAVLSIGMILFLCDLRVKLLWHIVLVLPLLVLAYGCKPNGLPVVIFLAFVWAFVYAVGISCKLRMLLFCVFSVVIFAFPSFLTCLLPVVKVPAMQYMQAHDLLGMGIEKGSLLLPDWMIEKTGITVEDAPKMHYAGGNNFFYYSTKGGNLTSTDPAEIDALNVKWLTAVISYPQTYLKVRWQYFEELIRLGSSVPCFIVQKECFPNEWGITYDLNFISRFLLWTTSNWTWLYLPWIYLLLSLLMTLSAAFLFRDELWRLILTVGLCGALFSSPHYFVGPADDFRYLHFSVVCALIQFAVLMGLVLQNLMSYARRRFVEK